MKHAVLRWSGVLSLPVLLAACSPAPVVLEDGAQSDPADQGGVGVTVEAPSPVTIVDQAEALWEQMTPRQQAASVLMLNYPGTDGAAMAQFASEIEPTGLILMGDGIPEDEDALPDIIHDIQATSLLPLLIAVDQEGGLVRRVTSDPTPGAQELREEDPDATEVAFATRAQRLSELGFNTNFGIVADWSDDPDSFIYPRVLGTDPVSSSERVSAAVKGESGVVLSALKHFPGHGSVAADSHTAVPATEMAWEDWRENEAAPFISGIDAGAEMVMMGHLAYVEVDPLPASLSPTWVSILREDLGFEGVIVTDDMKMLRDSGVEEFADAGQNAVAALKAGVDLVLDIGQAGVAPADFANHLIDTIVAAVDSGDLPEERLREAGVRVLSQRLDLAG